MATVGGVSVHVQASKLVYKALSVNGNSSFRARRFVSRYTRRGKFKGSERGYTQARKLNRPRTEAASVQLVQCEEDTRARSAVLAFRRGPTPAGPSQCRGTDTLDEGIDSLSQRPSAEES